MNHRTPPAGGCALTRDSGPAADAPMTPLDAWLYRHQSSGAVCMTAGMLAWFEGPAPSPARLRERVRSRWGSHERLRLTALAPTGEPRAWPRWATEPAWDPLRHVVAFPDPPDLPTAPEALAAQLLGRPLGPGRPPWRLHLVPSPGGFALLLVAHHALLDGTSLATLLRTLCDGPVPPPRRGTDPVPPPRMRLPLARALTDLLPRARPLPFHGPVDARRAVAYCRVPMAELSGAREALPSGRASANAVFLAATAGALRASGLLGRRPLPGAWAMVPVDVRTGDEAALLGNHYATVRVPLPGSTDPVRRLAAVDGFTRRAVLKQRARAQALLVASRPRRYGALTEALGRYADSPYYSSVLCSSVATHAGPLALGGARLTALTALPSLSPGHPLALTMTLHDAHVVVTAVTDHGHRHLAARTAALIGREIRALRP
ncbi:wax ester/triacylglycerol synthase domain-containing protein [Streptomyces cinnamoneus]|uniref:wax ester/triacylglycerol synthase domain-containing protein n=1 Tax=Streptomyces cinnamoneus TaxID=53446 RepID=UPI0037B3D248